MIALDEARSLIASKILPLPAHSVPLAEAAGRILRTDITAAEDMPAFDRSAVDGYAVGLDDDSPAFRLIGEAQPGTPQEISVGKGECLRVFTGSRIPAGASQVLMRENVAAEADRVTPQTRDREANIRYCGEDAKRGDRLLPSGTRLGPGELSLLAGFGIVLPPVSPAVRVVHFVTGNELVAPGQVPAPGQIRDSNGTLVKTMLHAWGAHVVLQDRLADDYERMLHRTHHIDRDWDLMLVSGGASVGDYDFGRRLLTDLGFEIHFQKLNLRPGKPLIFATRDAQAAFVLPGNPVAHFVTLHAAVRLAVDTFVGAAPHWPMVRAQLAEDFTLRPDRRETFCPAKASVDQGRLLVRAHRWQSSGDVTGIAGVNALLQIGSGSPGHRAGEEVNTLLLNPGI